LEQTIEALKSSYETDAKNFNELKERWGATLKEKTE
jgi:hypothetical protein